MASDSLNKFRTEIALPWDQQDSHVFYETEFLGLNEPERSEFISELIAEHDSHIALGYHPGELEPALDVLESLDASGYEELVERDIISLMAMMSSGTQWTARLLCRMIVRRRRFRIEDQDLAIALTVANRLFDHPDLFWGWHLDAVDAVRMVGANSAGDARSSIEFLERATRHPHHVVRHAVISAWRQLGAPSETIEKLEGPTGSSIAGYMIGDAAIDQVAKAARLEWGLDVTEPPPAIMIERRERDTQTRQRPSVMDRFADNPQLLVLALAALALFAVALRLLSAGGG